VSTDTRRLAFQQVQSNQSNELELIIPKKAIVEIQKLFSDEITIFYDETYLIIQSNHYFFFSKLINGKYPDYNRIIPKTFNYSLGLPKRAMIESIRQITTISQDIRVTFNNNTIVFQSLSDENSEAKTEIEIAVICLIFFLKLKMITLSSTSMNLIFLSYLKITVSKQSLCRLSSKNTT
jgi:DNA polymerase-3 subunit beta